MTDSQQDGGGLPTVGYLNYLTKRRPDTETPLKTKSISFRKIKSSTSHKLDIDVNDRHELVRLKDVKALIQDKIKRAEEKIQKYNGLDKLNLNDAKARKQELESFLEELEGEASE